MKRRSALIPFLFCFALCLTAANPLFAESLLDVVEAAQATILKKYPSKDSLARKIALEELEKIARSGETDEQIMEALQEKFPETSAELFARSDRNSNGVPDEWEKKFKVSPGFTAPESDEDSDGFNLLEEYKAGTDPVDPLSHPKYVTRICVSNVIHRRIDGLKLAFVDMMGKTGPLPDKRDWTVSFNVIRNGRKRTEFAGIGRGTFKSSDIAFAVTDIEIDDKTQEPVVYLQRVGKNERIPCRPKRPVYEPVPQVRFLDSLNGRTILSPIGGKFKLGSKKTGEEVYKVVSMDSGTKTAVVESVGEAPETFRIQPVPNRLPAAKAPAPAKPVAKTPAKPAAKSAEKGPVNLSVYAKQAEVNILTRQPVFAGFAAPFKAPEKPAAQPAAKNAARPSAKTVTKSSPLKNLTSSRIKAPAKSSRVSGKGSGKK